MNASDSDQVVSAEQVLRSVRGILEAEQATLAKLVQATSRASVDEWLTGHAGSGQLREWLLETTRGLFADERRVGGRWLEEIVTHAVSRELRSKAGRDRVDHGDWTPAFALDGHHAGLKPLPPVGDLGPATFVEVPDDLLGGVEIAERMARDPHPLPNTAEREGYYGDLHVDFWLGGLLDYLKVKRAVEVHGVEAPVSALDFGCATGRVLRHILCQEPEWEAWGTDINRQHVDWVTRYLPKHLKAFQGTVLPQLPLPDASLAVAYAFSVFTHIDDFEHAWLAELRRILRPGGLAYLTIHSEDTWQKMDFEGQLYRDLEGANEHILEYDVSPALFGQPMPEPKTVFRWHSATNNNTSVFHSTEYIHDVWGRFFDVLEIQRRASGYQDVVVLRRT